MVGISMGFIACKKCSAYYILKEEEYPEDFSDKCECGGKILYYDYIPLNKVYNKCPKCDNEDIAIAFNPLGGFCQKCHYTLFIVDKCLICDYEGIILEKDNINNFLDRLQLPKILYYTCPNCKNSFGFYNNIDRPYITKDKLFMIRTIGYFLVTLFWAILIIKQMFFP